MMQTDNTAELSQHNTSTSLSSSPHTEPTQETETILVEDANSPQDNHVEEEAPKDLLTPSLPAEESTNSGSFSKGADSVSAKGKQDKEEAELSQTKNMEEEKVALGSSLPSTTHTNDDQRIEIILDDGARSSQENHTEDALKDRQEKVEVVITETHAATAAKAKEERAPNEPEQIDFDALNNLEIEPEQQAFIRDHLEFIWKMLEPIIEGAMGGFSVYSIFSIIASGYQSWYQPGVQAFVKYPLPVMTVLTALNTIFEQNKRPGKKYHWCPEKWKAVINSTNLAAFTSQLTFFLITDATDHKRHLSAQAPVNISNPVAWVIVAICATIGALEGIRSHTQAKQLEEEQIKSIENSVRAASLLLTTLPEKAPSPQPNKGKLSRFVSHWAVSAILNGLRDSAILHSLVYEIEALAKISTSPLERIVRYTFTALGGVEGAIVGLQMPGTNKVGRFMNKFMNVASVTALGLGAYRIFTQEGNTSAAEEFWGEEALETQAGFWPAFTAFVIVLQSSIIICNSKPALRRLAQCVNPFGPRAKGYMPLLDVTTNSEDELEQGTTITDSPEDKELVKKVEEMKMT